MNQWVEDQTNKLLKGTIKEIAPETIAYLMNTVYFKGTWRNEYPESLTNKEAFYTTTQDSSFINMMHKTESLPYYEDELCQMTSLSYYGGSSMVVVLPKGDIDEYLKDLDDEILQNILVNGKDNNQRLQLSLPKLDIEVHNPLKELLANQGMEKAFSPNEAEFQSMIEVAGENVYVSDIFQNARIILDEKGTEAAAVTVVDMNVTSAQVPSEPIVFECNKPFLYIIKDDASGAILFVGIVRRP
jgi:serpin B